MSIVETTAEEVSTELDVRPVAPVSLFGTSDPVEVLERAGKIAAALRDVLRAQKMVTNIKGKEYVQVSGWTTLGSMLGVVPVVVWTRPVEGGWEARVEARTADGRTVGAAESMCVEAEGGNWGGRATSNARRSMAQTRAVSKALRGPLGFVVTLAGYEATPADEMPAQDASPPPAPAVAVTRAAAAGLVDSATAIGLLGTLQAAASHVARRDVGDCSTREAALMAMLTLTEDEAAAVDRWLLKKADEMTEEEEPRRDDR